jgi:hypothetical protein
MAGRRDRRHPVSALFALPLQSGAIDRVSGHRGIHYDRDGHA